MVQSVYPGSYQYVWKAISVFRCCQCIQDAGGTSGSYQNVWATGMSEEASIWPFYFYKSPIRSCCYIQNVTLYGYISKDNYERIFSFLLIDLTKWPTQVMKSGCGFIILHCCNHCYCHLCKAILVTLLTGATFFAVQTQLPDTHRFGAKHLAKVWTHP